MGGMYALLAACQSDDFAATVPFYGLLSHSEGLLAGDLDPRRKPHAPLDLASQLRCPLLAFFGADDELVSLRDVRELERRLQAVPLSAEVVVVSGAGHAFMNDTRPDAYRPEQARAAWARMVEFLRARLAPDD
jgi:carboxymethylenebutenolidase